MKKKTPTNKTFFSKENIAILISILTLIITFFQALYFVKQTRYLSEQTKTQQKALDEYKRNSSSILDLEFKNYDINEKKASSRILINTPRILKDEVFNNLSYKPVLMEVSVKNIGENFISDYEIKYIFFVGAYMEDNSSENIHQLDFFLPIDLANFKRKDNKVILIEKIDAILSEFSNKSYKMGFTSKCHYVYSTKKKVETTPKNSNINVLLDIGLKQHEDLFTEDFNHVIYLIMKIKFTDGITSKKYEKFDYFIFDQDWNSRKIISEEQIKNLKNEYIKVNNYKKTNANNQ